MTDDGYDKGAVPHQEQNKERLTGRLFPSEMIFHRGGLAVFIELVDGAKNGEITANEVIDFIDPNKRLRSPDPVSGYGLGYFISQDLRSLDGLAGFNKQRAEELHRQVYSAYENILRGLNLPDPSIRRRNESGEMENVPFTQLLGEGDQEDLIGRYYQEATNLFNYYEGLFSPADIVDYCTRRKEMLENYLSGGVNPRNNQPISEQEKTNEETRIKGLEDAIKRNQNAGQRMLQDNN